MRSTTSLPSSVNTYSNGGPNLRPTYARLNLDYVVVNEDATTVSGSKAALSLSTKAYLGVVQQGVLAFVQHWRPRQDSNLHLHE